MPGDQARYKMEMTDKVPKEYLGRALLITGSSVNVISKDHEKSAVKFNDDTAIKTNKERNHKTYYLMVTPEGLFLDNSVFCNGKNIVKRWTLDVIKEIPDTRRFESKNTPQHTVWRGELRLLVEKKWRMEKMTIVMRTLIKRRWKSITMPVLCGHDT
eukprot:scaffold36132_cov39-Attheya_sp.AAC.1